MVQQQFENTGVMNSVNQVKDNLIDDSKSSLKLGLELTAGTAALAVLRSFVVPAKITLVDRLTGKGALIKKVANSAYGSLAIAATFHVLSSIVGNTKLSRIAKLALDAAVVEASANLPIQQWVDSVANKLLSNSVVSNALDDVEVPSKKK